MFTKYKTRIAAIVLVLILTSFGMFKSSAFACDANQCANGSTCVPSGYIFFGANPLSTSKSMCIAGTDASGKVINRRIDVDCANATPDATLGFTGCTITNPADQTLINITLSTAKSLTPEAVCKEDAGGDTDNKAYSECLACLADNKTAAADGKAKVYKMWTGIGCIPATLPGIATQLMRIFYGISIGILVLRFILAGIYMQSGETGKVQESKEIIIAGISAMFIGGAGLIILQFIGVDVLGLKDFLTAFPTIK